MTDSPWKPDDKAWKAERTRQWRVVESNLKLLASSTGLKRGAFKLHKELFLEGTVGGKGLEALRSGGDAFLHMLPTFWLWYHPDPASVDLEALRESSLKHTRLRNATRRLFGDWSEAGAVPPDMLAPDYGLMGGRERLVVALLCPGLDHHASVMDPGGKSHPACLSPDLTYRICLGHSTRELRTDATFYPHAPGQFLWPQLVFAMEHYPDEALVEDQNGSTETKRHELKRVIAEVLGFERREDASRNRPSTVAFVARVLAAQAAGFTGEMAALWQEAADEQGLLVRESAELGRFHMSGAQIDEWYDVQWSHDERQARVDRWESG